MPETPVIAPAEVRRPLSSKRLLKKAAARSHAGHSDVYRWLRRQHKSVNEALSKHNPSWQAIADLMVADDVTGRFGTKPNAKSVPKVWERVCRDVRAEAQFQATGVAKRGKSKVSAAGHGARALGGGTPGQAVTSVPGPVVRPQPVEPVSVEIGDTKPGVAGPVDRSVSLARIAEIRLALTKV